MNNIIPNGTKIKTRSGDIEGITKGVVIRGVNNGSIEYHVGYFAQGEYKEIWLYDFELEVKIDNSKPAGFRTGKELKIY